MLIIFLVFLYMVVFEAGVIFVTFPFYPVLLLALMYLVDGCVVCLILCFVFASYYVCSSVITAIVLL